MSVSKNVCSSKKDSSVTKVEIQLLHATFTNLQYFTLNWHRLKAIKAGYAVSFSGGAKDGNSLI